MWNQKFHYHVRSSPPLDVILSHMNPNHILTCSFKDSCNIHLHFIYALFSSLTQLNRVINGKVTFAKLINKLPCVHPASPRYAYKNPPLDPSLTLKSISSDPILLKKEIAFVTVRWIEMVLCRVYKVSIHIWGWYCDSLSRLTFSTRHI
jgi:hypothetical protein